MTSTPPSAPGSADAGVVAVSGFEYGFTPSTISVPAGEVAFAVTNTGTVEHEFEVFRGETVVDEVGGPGARAHPGPQGHPRSRRLPVRLQISGREQAGMTGTLTVVE